MSRRRRRHPPGTAPGILTAPAERRVESITIKVIDYNAERYEEAEVATVDETLAHLDRDDSVTWVDITGVHDVEMLAAMGEHLGLHPLALEDVVNTHQRPKLEDYGSHNYVVLRLPRLEGELSSEQYSLFLGRGWVLTFQETAGDPFEAVRDRLRRGRVRIRGAGSDYLAYALIDAVVDAFFPLLEQYGERIETLEDELLDRPERSALQRVHDIKGDLLEIRRATWPLREVINGFERQEVDLISDQTRLFLRDCYDHTVQIMDIVETYRDLSSALTDLYLSSVSNRMNEVMKVLTVIASIFIPLTFLAGIYGMNFNPEVSRYNMPELNWAWGYPVFWVVIVGLAGFMVWLFRRRGWL